MAITLQDLDNMSSAEYKQKLNDPAFVAEVDLLLHSPQATQAAPVAQPAEEALDPSMPDKQSARPVQTSVRDHAAPAPVPVATPIPQSAPAVVPPAPTVLPEQTYSWQPTDEQGRPLGGRQVIKYRTEQEKFDRVIEQNTLILRQLRKVSRDARLGVTENIPANAVRMEITELQPQELSPEERFQLTQDLNDPEKFSAARDRLLESALGKSPADLRKMLNDQQMKLAQLAAKENFLTFAQTNPDFYADTENVSNLADWMIKNKLAPTVDNFKLACSTLRSAGLLNEAPVVQQVPVPSAPAVEPVESVVPQAQEPVVEPARISVPAPVQPKRQVPVPSGLNDRVSSASGRPSVGGDSVTLADIDKMSADEYKKAARNPAFKDLVNRLEKEASDKRRQRANA